MYRLFHNYPKLPGITMASELWWDVPTSVPCLRIKLFLPTSTTVMFDYKAKIWAWHFRDLIMKKLPLQAAWLFLTCHIHCLGELPLHNPHLTLKNIKIIIFWLDIWIVIKLVFTKFMSCLQISYVRKDSIDLEKLHTPLYCPQLFSQKVLQLYIHRKTLVYRV